MPAEQVNAPPEGEQWEEHVETSDLDSAAVRAVDDQVIERLVVPEWRGAVYVRNLAGRERDAFEDASITGRGKDRRLNLRNIRARLVVMATCDAQGKPLFAERDIGWLGEKSAAALDRIFDVAQRLSRISDDDVEELAKNSENAPSDDFGSS